MTQSLFSLLFIHSTATRRNLVSFGSYKHVKIWYQRLCSRNFSRWVEIRIRQLRSGLFKFEACLSSSKRTAVSRHTYIANIGIIFDVGPTYWSGTGAWRDIVPLSFQNEGLRGRRYLFIHRSSSPFKPVLSSIIGNYVVYQDRREKNLLQLFAHPEN